MIALRPSRALVVLLMAVLVAGRLWVPAGWMPANTQQGFSVILCSGSGPTEAWIDAAGKLHRDHRPAGKDGHKGDPRDPCPFGAISAPAALPAAPALAALPLLAAPALALSPVAIGRGRGLAAPPPPATGPPLSA